MPDYSKAKIYRVFCEEDEYIGSTIRPLSERMYSHRQSFKQGNKSITSYIIFETHGIENVKIELIEEYPCDNREQLLKREGEIQRERKCVNKNIAGETYQYENKSEYDKAYYNANYEKLRENREKRMWKNYHYYAAKKRETREKNKK